MGVSSLPKTVTRQRRGCDLNPGSTAPESSTLTTRLPSGEFGIMVEFLRTQLVSGLGLVADVRGAGWGAAGKCSAVSLETTST